MEVWNDAMDYMEWKAVPCAKLVDFSDCHTVGLVYLSRIEGDAGGLDMRDQQDRRIDEIYREDGEIEWGDFEITEEDLDGHGTREGFVYGQDDRGNHFSAEATWEYPYVLSPEVDSTTIQVR